MPGKPGQIITFYSYKGGTGRTMALANVAWILASNGKRVLAVDWDLEAPGLHRYFRPFLLDKDLTSSAGIIDLVWDFAAATVAPLESAREAEPGWHKDYADILRYVIALRWSFRSPGKLDFLPPGLQGPAYAARVNSFDWQNFYNRLGGGAFLESVKERMRKEYDYILIDSRTGVSDTSGICTVQMPDDLITCFTANHQSLEGALAVASSIRKQWAETKIQETQGRIFPVLMRAEPGELAKLALVRQEARSRFSPFLEFLPAGLQEEYWGAVEISYIPWYAFEEVLAPFVDEPKAINSLLGAAERLTGYLTNREVVRVVPPSREERAPVLKKYLRAEQTESLEQPLAPVVSTVVEGSQNEPEHESLPSVIEERIGPYHQETQKDLPYLLKQNELWPSWRWPLPATSLSFASAITQGSAVGLLLQRNAEMRPLFVLPSSVNLTLAVISSCLAWLIAIGCSHRPGELWPRVWALYLALLTSTTIALAPFSGSALLSAVVVADFAAVVTLLPRLLKLRPDSDLLYHIPVLVFLAVLLIVLPFTSWLLCLPST